MRPFGFCDRTFDSNMIYFVIVVSVLSFGFKVCV
jgi:hypothetical protein